jgi:CHAT domain-containing protein
MKIKSFVFLSFFTLLSTSSLALNPHIKYFHTLPVAAEEINDLPQTLEDADKLIKNLPNTRAGSSLSVQIGDLEHPQYLKIKLDAIENLKKALPIYQKYSDKQTQEWVSARLCEEYLEIGRLVNIGEEYFRDCQNVNSAEFPHINFQSIAFFVEVAKNSGRHSEAIKAVQKEIEWQKKYLETSTENPKSPEEWRQTNPKFLKEFAFERIGKLYLILGELTQSSRDYQLALKYFEDARSYILQFISKQEELEQYQSEYPLAAYYQNTGIALLGMGKLDEAEARLRKTLNYATSYFYRDYFRQGYLPKILIEKKKYEEALESSEKFLPESIEGYESNPNTLNYELVKTQIPQLSLQEVRDLAKEKNTTIVKYLLFDKEHEQITIRKSKFAVFVIKPNGEIHFRQVDAANLNSHQEFNINKLLKPLNYILVISVILTLGIAVYFLVRKQNRLALLAFSLSGVLLISLLLPVTQNQFASSSQNENSKTNSYNSLILPHLVFTTVSKFRDDKDLNQKISQIEDKSCQNEDDCLHQLHQILIQPIADLLPQNPEEHITFIPPEYLSKVPFAALKDEKGKYLIEKHTIYTAPAIRLLQFANQQVQQNLSEPNTKALIVGNPIMPKAPIDIKVTLYPEPSGYKQLQPLAATEIEAKEIASLWQTQPLIGDQATELAFMQQAPEANIIHLATHGLNLINGSSFLALAPTEYNNQNFDSTNERVDELNPADGLLTPEAIEKLNLKAELVVLSACDTGLSPITGDLGFATPFLAKGVPSVVVSLWEVPDAPTSELMVDFYNNLKSNPDKAQALRQAMLTTMKKHPDPVNWAGFTLVGRAK